MLSALENGLFALGQVMRLPVMILLWACVLVAVYVAAACVMEAVLRRRERAGFRLSSWLSKGAVLNATDARRNELPAPLRKLVDDIRARRGPPSDSRQDGSAPDAGARIADGDLENLILEREERLRASTALARALVRIAPSLGLIGTLIPMGASLASLASGNLQAMAGQMVVAFTTTIIGLATGTLAYVVTTVRQKWATETVREQRYLAERIVTELAAGT
jgi:biopolymer transport protein ExbB/TolQ